MFRQIKHKSLGRYELLKWLNTFLEADYSKIEHLGDGLAYCQIFDAIFPGQVPLHLLNFNAKTISQKKRNLKVLEDVFTKCGIKKEVPIVELASCKFQGNLDFLQYCFAILHQSYPDACRTYNAFQRRQEALKRRREYEKKRINRKKNRKITNGLKKVASQENKRNSTSRLSHQGEAHPFSASAVSPVPRRHQSDNHASISSVRGSMIPIPTWDVRQQQPLRQKRRNFSPSSFDGTDLRDGPCSHPTVEIPLERHPEANDSSSKSCSSSGSSSSSSSSTCSNDHQRSGMRRRGTDINGSGCTGEATHAALALLETYMESRGDSISTSSSSATSHMESRTSEREILLLEALQRDIAANMSAVDALRKEAVAKTKRQRDQLRSTVMQIKEMVESTAAASFSDKQDDHQEVTKAPTLHEALAFEFQFLNNDASAF